MVNVLEPITTKLGPTSENVIPPAVMAFVVMAGGAMVVPPGPAIPTPLGPMLIVWPFMISVVGVASAPSVMVWLPRTTMPEPISEKVTPAAVRTWVGPAGLAFCGWKTVVPLLLTPLGPIVYVCPLTVTVVGFAAGPTVNVWVPRRRVEPICVRVM
jgi:hypothetical protein